MSEREQQNSLREHTMRMYCDNHQSKIIFYCHSDRMYLCEKCLQLQEIHISHQISNITDLIKLKQGQVHTLFEHFNMESQTIDQIIHRSQQNLQTLIQESQRYQSVIKQVQRLLHELNVKKDIIENAIENIKEQKLPVMKQYIKTITDILQQDFNADNEFDYLQQLNTRIHQIQNLKQNELQIKNYKMDEINNFQQDFKQIQERIDSILGKARSNFITSTTKPDLQYSPLQRKKILYDMKSSSDNKTSIYKILQSSPALLKKTVGSPNSQGVNQSSIIQKLKKQKECFLSNRIKFVC